MSVILYDGKGKIGYYTELIKLQTGSNSNHVIHFPYENLFIGTLGETFFNLLIKQYFNNYIQEYRQSIQTKKFNVFDLMKYVKDNINELIVNPEKTGHYLTFIYDGTVSPIRIYALDQNGVDEYSYEDVLAFAKTSEIYKGALTYCNDIEQVLKTFQSTFNHLNSPYNIVQMRG